MSRGDEPQRTPAWLLDEVASAGRENLDAAHVDRYDSKMDAGAADEVEDRIEAWCAPFGDEVEGDWARWEMEEHIRDEHSTFVWLLESMFEHTGFTVEEADYSDDQFEARYVLRTTAP